jgi:hypothetical protein
MAGLIPNDGENLIANMIFKNADANRGTSLQLGLFTNATGVDETLALASVTEPTGGTYARKTLADASWTVTADLASYALQTFTATGSAFTGSIYGYFIATTGTTPKLLAIEIDPAGPYTMAQNDAYDVTPNITVA